MTALWLFYLGSRIRLPSHPVPVVILARLAVDRNAPSKRLGDALLLDALERSLQLADQLGIHAIEVDAIDQQARKSYEKYGFLPLPDNALHLYLPIATIRESLGSSETKGGNPGNAPSLA